MLYVSRRSAKVQLTGMVSRRTNIRKSRSSERLPGAMGYVRGERPPNCDFASRRHALTCGLSSEMSLRDAMVGHRLPNEIGEHLCARSRRIEVIATDILGDLPFE
jgi:hypothetical protein